MPRYTVTNNWNQYIFFQFFIYWRCDSKTKWPVTKTTQVYGDIEQAKKIKTDEEKIEKLQ